MNAVFRRDFLLYVRFVFVCCLLFVYLPYVPVLSL